MSSTPARRLFTFHLLPPPVGCLEVATTPSAPTATQRDLEGQEMCPNLGRPGTLVTFQADAPAVGCVELTTLPSPSTATHTDGEGQETSRKSALAVKGGWW
jgi:hypothetical protein